ncbi:MAG: hypothetical protein IPP37_08260 [Saprospiraceae bacterium]|nr:hypothetical protein [Saprospiraceae bacterium]
MAEGYGEVFTGVLDFTGSVIPVTSCVPPTAESTTVLTPGSFTLTGAMVVPPKTSMACLRAHTVSPFLMPRDAQLRRLM